MTDKAARKSKRFLRADLNFVSQKPLGEIAEELQRLKHKAVQSQVLAMDDKTALFRLLYTRNGRITAEVAGRLQRWAGDMTHVYCDGRTLRKFTSYISGVIRWVLTAALVAPFIACPLFYFSGQHPILQVLLSTSITAFTVVGVGLGLWLLFSHFFNKIGMQLPGRRPTLQKPEVKDRERLLDVLTEVIRDTHLGQQLPTQDAHQAEPLSEAEIKAIIEQAEMMARLKN